MRHFAMTGMVTASWISLIFSGADMRATPPSRRMSAGTRSSAITAHAPASSAILACSALTTSMITPPFSISARPPLTRMVPTSCIAAILAGGRRQKTLDGETERLRLLEERQVPGVVEEHDFRAADPVAERRRGGRPADEVVAARDHERLRVDAMEVRLQVERGRVERAERVGWQTVDLDERAEALIPDREVQRRDLVPDP